jgi:spore coat polysaccharide biosynthesis protein SpsF
VKIGIILFCRYNSSRLPGKILRQINGKPVLAYIYERLCYATPEQTIVVATSREDSDRPIVDYCQKHHVPCFRGDLNNVAQRFLDCALYYDFDYAVRITGDSLFVSPQIIRAMLPFAESGTYDFISNKKERTFPVGMSVEIARTRFYEDAITKFNQNDHFEHVTLYFYENEQFGQRFYFYNQWCPEAGGAQMAIDSQEDLARATRMLNQIKRPHTDYDLCDWIAIRQEDELRMGKQPEAGNG